MIMNLAALFLLGNNCVANGKQNHELFNNRGGGVVLHQVLIEQALLQLLGGAGWDVQNFSYGATLELHHIAGEGARLICEDVLHHAQFFVQVGSSRSRWGVGFHVVHFNVHRNKYSLQKGKVNN